MMLKQSFAGAVASVALISAAHTADLQPVLKAPAAVEQQATGYVEVYSGWASIRETSCINASCSSERFNGWALGGAGRANYWITREVSVQVDAQAEGTSYNFSGGHFSTHSYLVGGHWSWRSPQQYLFGLFAAAGDAGSVGVTGDSQRHVLIGLKLHLGDRTLQQTDRAGATLDIVSPLANPTSPLVFLD